MKRAKSLFWLREPNEQKPRFRKKGGQKVHFKTPKYMYIPIGRKKTSKKSTLKKKDEQKVRFRKVKDEQKVRFRKNDE